MLADYIMLSPFLSNIPVRGAVNVLALALALGLHVVGLELTTDSRGMDCIDDLIDEFDPRFLSFSRHLAVIPYFPH